MSGAEYFVGVDVGTGSVRAGIVSSEGQLIASHVESIQMWSPKPSYYQQSSQDIWQAVCCCVRSVIKASKLRVQTITGIGFDATCSLVVLDEKDRPLSVSPVDCKQNAVQNVIVWMDHRAVQEADFINSTKHRVLQYVGGKMSPEMQPPKLLWLKKHHPQTFRNAHRFLDLTDFLTYKATNNDARSLCTVSCKWTFQPRNKKCGSDGGWNASFWSEIGLSDFINQDFASIGGSDNVQNIGSPVGSGLSTQAASELGLQPGLVVATGLIDAHSGALGMLGVDLKDDDCQDTEVATDLTKRLAVVVGTSACHLTLGQNARFVSGVWGPYQSVVIPGLWTLEGGQSAAGKLLDYIVTTHAAYPLLMREIQSCQPSLHPHLWLNSRLEEMAREQQSPSIQYLSSDFHILPYFHGNRSPIADSTLKGIKCGLTLENGTDQLAIEYLACLQALAYGTRHIIESLSKEGGLSIDTLCMSGGLCKNPLYIQTHADVTGCRVALPREEQCVLIGAAITAAMAREYRRQGLSNSSNNSHGLNRNSILQIMSKMTHCGQIFRPDRDSVSLRKFHNQKYSVYRTMYEHQILYKQIMKGGKVIKTNSKL